VDDLGMIGFLRHFKRNNFNKSKVFDVMHVTVVSA